jgi:Dolichyl-phosphate-mannose-protein mannosyltransferase
MTAPRWPVLVAAALVVIGSLRIISTFTVFNHTIDEPDNLAAGMEYLSTGRFLYEDVHPPLARVFSAVGPFLAGERFRRGPDSFQEGYRILGTGVHYERILALGRAGILPFFWIASAVVFLWGRRAGGDWAAVFAVLLFTTMPPVLALSGVINTDAALCAMTGAAGLGGLWWADRPDRRRSAIFGVLLGLAAVSKFSSMPFLLAAFAFMLAVGRPKVRPNWRSLAWVAATAALVIWAVYGFSFARVGFLNLRLPAPRFFTGIHAVMTHNRLGHTSFLMGRRSPNGFWYYFPAVLAVKTPLALFGLLLASLWLVFRGKDRLQPALALAFSAGVLAASLSGHIDIGVRFILPVYIGLAVVAGCAAARARGWAAVLCGALILWQVASGALAHPDYLAYTNEIAGSHPERFVVDSDLDWGQDMKRLGDFLRQHGAASVAFTPFNRTYALPVATEPGNPEAPSPGWNAVSVTIWKDWAIPAWADRMPPQYRVGKSILVWYVDAGHGPALQGAR